MNIQDLTLTRLIEEHQLQNFDCGDDDLNDFLHNSSWDYQKELLTVTYFFEELNGKAVVFFSVSNDALKDQDYEKWNNLSRKISNKKRRKDYPAVKIGRLGVDINHKGKNIGSQVVSFIKTWFAFDNKTGCRFVLVDAYNRPEIIDFYNKNGFILLTEKDSGKKTRLMYFDLKTLLPKSPNHT